MEGWLKTGGAGLMHLDLIAILTKKKNRNLPSTKYLGISQN